jgi:hypothetical protein
MRKPITHELSAAEVLDARRAIESGIGYLRMCIAKHDRSLRRTTLRGRIWAKQMDKDLDDMLGVLTRLPFSKLPHGRP